MHRSSRHVVVISPVTSVTMLLALSLASIASCDRLGDDLMDDPQWREVVVPLPSGVACSVEVTTPPDGAVLAAAPVAVTGFATVGQAVPVATTTMVYVMDLSGSTDVGGGCGGDANGDGSSNTILDCEIAALTELHEQATALGTVYEVGLAVFASSGAAADVMPGGTPNDLLTGPATDLGGPGIPDNVPNGVADVVDVMRSARSDAGGGSGTLSSFSPRSVGQFTSFGAGLTAAGAILGAGTQPNQLVVFVSDGLSNTSPSVAAALGALPAGATVFTFAVGASSSCDSDPSSLGSLRDIADATGGTCTNVPNPSDLPNILPGVIMSELVGLVLTLDGSPVAVDTVSPSIPQEGPATVQYSTTLPTPAFGLHTICATATCTDASGSGHPVECSTFRINAPPEAKCKDVSVEADAACLAEASIDDGSFDPDGDAITCTADPPGPYGLGTTVVALTCTDPHGGSDSCTGHVEVVDVTPPTVVTAGTVATLWPPNHAYHEFSVVDCVLEIHDNCAELEAASATEVSYVTSDEDELALGSGNTCDDAIIHVPPTSYAVRAERSGNGDGRVYHVGHVVSDPSGNHTDVSCQITVPHSQGPNGAAVDSGCALCVGSGCQGCSTGAPACG
jgi:hypothetical protein